MARSEWSSDMMNRMLGWLASTTATESCVQADSADKPMKAAATHAKLLVEILTFPPMPCAIPRIAPRGTE